MTIVFGLGAVALLAIVCWREFGPGRWWRELILVAVIAGAVVALDLMLDQMVGPAR